MLGIDTNVLVRLIVSEDAAQTRQARRLVAETLARDVGILVSLLVLMETEWVLRSRYGLKKGVVLDAMRQLLASRELSFEDESAVEEALYYWKDTPCGFVDCLVAAHNRRLRCRATATFDIKAHRIPGFIAV